MSYQPTTYRVVLRSWPVIPVVWHEEEGGRDEDVIRQVGDEVVATGIRNLESADYAVKVARLKEIRARGLEIVFDDVDNNGDGIWIFKIGGKVAASTRGDVCLLCREYRGCDYDELQGRCGLLS